MFKVEAETRRAAPLDANQIFDVYKTSWLNAYAGILPYKALTRMINRRDSKWWASAINKTAVILVMEFGDQVVGYATIGPNRVNSFAAEGEIYELYIKPEYQGLGLGRKLFKSAQKELKRRGYKGSVVWVLSDNNQGVRFYHGAGGTAVAIGTETFDDVTLEKTAFHWN